MNAFSPLPPALLKRKAVVYVRQSSQSQVMQDIESQRRQYDLVHAARQHGSRRVEVIDDDSDCRRHFVFRCFASRPKRA
ncbi:hypothetical protein EMEDMD4_1060042 [Sinorhizobium medicae]|uniref:Resolvase/invertase-type recombinase catalytic domain-containing protein n=1 Tax=Sinorhizobium medicae TaxID=110321 RepID=A0A508WPF8_9HYPH|nr:hypothetical protein EMEDMD4_1060042 [Sinorhizobium medicae]